MEEEDQSEEPKPEKVEGENIEESPPKGTSPAPEASPSPKAAPSPEAVPSPKAAPSLEPTPARGTTPPTIKSPNRSVTLDLKSPASERGPLSPGGASPKTSPRKLTSGAFDESETPGDEVVASGRNALAPGSTRNSSPGVVPFACAEGLLQKRSPFIHNPPHPEERRARIACPRTPREYIINLREDLADFQESHGLPRTRDYSFVSLGLALAQETGRAIYSLFLMLTELFPIIAILSLILRFALDKLIEILETTETVPKLKKTVIFVLEMLAILIPLWILTATIVIPLVSLIFSIFKRMLRIKGGGGKRKASCKPKGKVKANACGFL